MYAHHGFLTTLGNQLSSSGVSSYTYSPSNELVSTPTARYVYGANGKPKEPAHEFASGLRRFGLSFHFRRGKRQMP